ncbi:methyltransferase domain-containing protein [Cytophagales bacterium LB-30]|uniref:Methyltransferase domain-containing protein n=1 Tax=Shiella aurantiaca TaxID=3058365 RepID=A0ABT8F7Z0_9BACT|nr:methyltransferase domain-containing protein [Shiella aurantiaca]MDN4166398.1 methyltransferase domain-containing protein [Shiella aurantiaca]
MSVYTTEIASDSIESDNPVHQRLLKAYYLAIPHISGKLLELGCGEGRGVELLAPLAESYLALDKIGEVIARLSEAYPNHNFKQAVFPPLQDYPEASFDTIVSFQVIEHIENDALFLKEIYRLLKPGGKALISTPNIKLTLTRNPWHVREYTAEQLRTLCEAIFDKVEAKGVAGDTHMMEYHEKNRASVRKITRFDIFNLQYRLPAPLLRLPYDLLNRLNRNRLNAANKGLVTGISQDNFLLSEDADTSLDLFYILHKKA